MTPFAAFASGRRPNTGVVLLTLTACLDCSGNDRSSSRASDSADAGPAAVVNEGAVDAAQRADSSVNDASVETGPTPDSDAASGSDGATIDAPEDSSASACPIQQSSEFKAGGARSAGFTGTESNFYALFGGPCQVPGDCVPPCVAAGGTDASCMSGSACLLGEASDGGLGCSPPPYWETVTGALSESGTTTNAAHVVLIASPYEDQLFLTHFSISIPDDVTVTGIQFRVRRGTLAGNAADDTVQIVKNGVPVGANHGQTGGWPTISGSSLSGVPYGEYGGAYDLWGGSWSATDLEAPDFGLSITPKYTGPTAGNEFSYIDSVRVSVFYTAPCE